MVGGRREVRVLGIDGTRGGWVGVRWDGAEVTLLHDRSLTGLCEQAGPVAVVAVDMPIGLERSDRRACDEEVRSLLGARRSSLFAPPVLEALSMPTYAEANAWSKAALGRGISKQAWMLVDKIREVRAVAESTDLPMFETFPELSFRAMQRDVPLSHAKRTWTGMATRLRLLEREGIVLPVEAGAAGDVAADDLLDAASVAWSAMRIATGRAEHRPLDRTGDPPTIWW